MPAHEDPTDLTLLWRGRPVAVVDAARSGAAPGTLVIVDLADAAASDGGQVAEFSPLRAPPGGAQASTTGTRGTPHDLQLRSPSPPGGPTVRAESYGRTDPRTAVFYARRFVEQVVEWIYELEHLTAP